MISPSLCYKTSETYVLPEQNTKIHKAQLNILSYLLAAEGTDSVDGEAGLNGVEPNRSSLNGSAFC
jgi:hypothetical protein